MDPVSPAGLLDRIVQTKKKEVQSLQDPAPAEGGEPLSFIGAIRRSADEKLKIIAECKRASPSEGLLKETYDPLAIALQYRELGASAISVLTDREFFQGDLNDLVRARGCMLPVLRKDFIISPKQIFEAKGVGASAILLIVRILDNFQLRDFLAIARSLAMDALVEIHNENEMERALNANASIIGVNHRDLDTLKMDLSLTSRLVPEIKRALPDTVIVAESGVESRDGLRAVEEYADAVLIGSALLKSNDLPATWHSIFG